MSFDLDSMISTISLSVLFGILELLLHKRHFPLLVIHIFVALAEGILLCT